MNRNLPAFSPTSDEVRSDIRRTEMSGTIDAMQSRLSPRRFVTDAKNTVTKAMQGRMKNPISIAVAGVTATAVLLQAWKRFRRDAAGTKAEPFPAPERITSNGIGRHKTGIVMGTCAAIGGGALMAWRKGMFRTAANPRLVTSNSIERPFGTN
jgi:hypothetical protein